MFLRTARSLAIPPALVLALALGSPVGSVPSEAKGGIKPVTTGPVLRGITLDGPVQPPGTGTSEKCTNFLKDVNGDGLLDDASVQCDPNAAVDAKGIRATLKGLSPRFNAYCFIDAKNLRGRLIQSKVGDNTHHCSLSGMKAQKAVDDFSTAVWR